jgi:molybdopterin-guanine dinucleotide biosynthesis protein A
MLKQWEQSFKDGSFSPAPPHPAIPSGTRDMSVPIEALAKNTVNIIQAAILDPPLIGEMQNMVRNGILPHIDYALAHFAIVEQDTAFEFPISGKMQGDIHQNPVYLDNTEVYIMDGMLRGLKAIAEQFLVYKFELPVYTAPALAEALQSSNTTFFYRASDGVVRSQSVLADVTSMIGKFKSAINYLKSETDNQSDDIIKIAQQGINGPSVAELDTMLANLDRAADALTTTQTVRLINADTDYHNYTMLVNISAFYNNPPQNPKTAWLPAYTVDTTADGDDVVWNWQAQTYEEFNFPDSTFSGLFEGITNEYTSGTNMNENLKRILHIDEEFPQN